MSSTNNNSAIVIFPALNYYEDADLYPKYHFWDLIVTAQWKEKNN